MSFFGFLITGSNLGDIQFADNEFIKFASIIIFLGVFVTVSIFAHSITTLQIINTISSYVYVRVNLKTEMSFSEVSKIKEMFVPNPTGQWQPCTEVTDLPQNQRAEYLKQVYRQTFNI
tara:strand:+ start:2014 stop:2367 length:354 start_codon:yes stop_codon:yes gene_type:complete